MSTINDNDTKTNEGKAQHSATPKLMLRTYRPTDYEAVRALYTSTLFALVPEGVRRKLWSASTWIIWFLGYSILLTVVPNYLVKMVFPGVDIETSYWIKLLKLVLTFVWAMVGFSAMFIITERFEITDKVEQALANDLNDPDSVYLHYEQDDNAKVRRRKVSTELDEVMPGHFWVLLANEEVCGMVGLAPASDHPLLDQRPHILPIWKQVIKSLHLPIPFSSSSSSVDRPVIIPAQPQHTATIARWAIANDYQQCGLSSLLIHRVMTWAQENELTDIYAITNEVQMAAEQILQKRHGFQLVKKNKIGWFGRYECIWKCHVDDWVEQNKNHVNSKFKPTNRTS
ncbi:uncharacterized protein BX664DRAFT_340482 [Halteromyces radiatus]|uniref:uncharacterized protein n=1 Tax=Halteromyces radiatus TaxID=101107 RepID=UPI00221E9E13|nr:uncharacterized protein BX664DRAFT_340482 [Halteromyces radiatus]KAI8081477.1 hypothetical protein BX664DRAFT_340482 [Halteromyces radiatus]